MSPEPGGGDAMASLIDATGLSISPDDMSTATGSGCDDPFAFEPERAIAVLAEALKRVHGLAIRLSTPETATETATESASGTRSGTATEGVTVAETTRIVTPRDLVARARAQLELSEDERGVLSPAYSHMRREDLLAVLDDRAAIADERSPGLVLNQGIPTLANLRFRGIELLGFADWSQASMADPHFDLAIACRDLLRMFGGPPVREFIEVFAAGSLDPVLLDWYTLAVELGP